MAALLAACTVRPLIELVPDTPLGIRSTRRALRAFTDVWCRSHHAVEILPVVAPATGGTEVRGEWVMSRTTSGRRPDPGDGVVFYVHGGGYAVASARTHRAITSRLAVLTGRPVFACDYRLTPTHTFPAAADDVAAAFDWLIASGATPGTIVVAGDSAGGQLALALAAERAARGFRAAGLLLFSPLVDLSLSRAREWESGPRRDPLMSVDRVERLLTAYLGGADLSSSRLQVTAESLTGLPPLHVHVSSAELLFADARHLVDLADLAGGEARLLQWPGQLHVFQALAGFVPEAMQSLSEAARFVRDRLDRARPHDPMTERSSA